MRQESENTSFGEPDEAREFPNGRAEILAIGDAAWVVGDQPVAVVDWYGASNHAKGS
jgi:hypothetical protein